MGGCAFNKGRFERSLVSLHASESEGPNLLVPTESGADGKRQKNGIMLIKTRQLGWEKEMRRLLLLSPTLNTARY